MPFLADTGESFSISEVGSETHKTWAGDFRVKVRLSWRDQLQQDQIRRELIGKDPEHASQDAIAMALIVSELQVRVIDGPEWWRDTRGGLDFYDDNVILKIYEECKRVVAGTVEQVAKEKEADVAVLKEIKKAQDEVMNTPVPGPRRKNKVTPPPEV